MKNNKIINFQLHKKNCLKASSLFAEGVYLAGKNGMRKLAIDKFQQAEKLGYTSSKIYCHIAYLCNVSETDIAMKALDKAMLNIENDYYESDIYYLKGWFLWQNDKIDEALDYLLRAEKLGQTHYYIYNAIINALFTKKDYFKLNAFTSKAINKFPNEPVFYKYKGYCNEALEKYEDALKYYLKAEELGSTDVFDNISDVYIKLGDTEKALDYLNKDLLTDKNYYTYHKKGNFFYYTLSNYDKALEYYEKAESSLTPDVMNSYAFMYSNMSWIYAKKNEKEKSIDYAQKAYSLDPENGWCTYRLACVYLYIKNDLKNAKFYLDKAVKNKFNGNCIYFEYIHYYLLKKQYKKALEYVDNYEKLCPDDNSILDIKLTILILYKKFNKALDILKQSEEERALSVIELSMISFSYYMTNNAEKSLEYFVKFANELPYNYNFEEECYCEPDIEFLVCELERKFPFNRILSASKSTVYNKININCTEPTTFEKQTALLLKLFKSKLFWIIYICIMLLQVILKVTHNV